MPSSLLSCVEHHLAFVGYQAERRWIKLLAMLICFRAPRIVLAEREHSHTIVREGVVWIQLDCALKLLFAVGKIQLP